MKLIQGGKKDPAINDQDWKFIKNSLRQCIATKFITESEKEEMRKQSTERLRQEGYLIAENNKGEKRDNATIRSNFALSYMAIIPIFEVPKTMERVVKL